MADAKRLAKNTLYMYARMILIMIVSIYTSRVVLDSLGVDDYGIYNAVASIVAMISFLNATLSTSTSRYLTYDIGRGDPIELRRTFLTSFYVHLALSFIVVLLLETIGLWYIGNRFVIPEGREYAVQAVFHISVFTTAIAVIQVPYSASIIAHENMDVYAAIGIAEVVLKLGIVFLLTIIPFDKLIVYSLLIALLQVLFVLTYGTICYVKYPETRLSRLFSPRTFREMMGFTGWTAVANLSNTMIVQGSTVLLNLFFAPAVIAGKAIADQITNAVNQFVNNFRVALNPQIIKSYAAGELTEFKTWSLRSTVVACDLMIVLGFPCITTMKTILNIWLVEVPPLAVEFTQLALLSQIVAAIHSSTYIPFVASGRLRLNAIWGAINATSYFIGLYLCFKLGVGALWVQWLYLMVLLISAFGVRPYLMHRELGFSYDEVFRCLLGCLKPMLMAGLLSWGLHMLLGDSLWEQALLFVLVFFVCCVVTWLFLEKAVQLFIMNEIRAKLKKR